MKKKTYTYFYCAECYMMSGVMKVGSVVNACEKVNMNNYGQIYKEIAEDAKRFAKEKYGEFPTGVAITSLSFLHENDEEG